MLSRAPLVREIKVVNETEPLLGAGITRLPVSSSSGECARDGRAPLAGISEFAFFVDPSPGDRVQMRKGFVRL